VTEITVLPEGATEIAPIPICRASALSVGTHTPNPFRAVPVKALATISNGRACWWAWVEPWRQIRGLLSMTRSRLRRSDSPP
jgi:hypothetical protein